MPSGVNVPASFVRARNDRDFGSSATEIDDGSRAIEVQALFEESVIAVAHLTNPRGGRVSRTTQALLSAGAFALTIPVISFIVAYVDMVRAQRAYEALDRAGIPHQALTIPYDGSFTDIAAALCFVTGFYLLIRGALRLDAERAKRDFTIGSTRDANVPAPLEQVPVASFPLVRAIDDHYALQFTPQMSGDITLANGKTVSLAQLVDTGEARTSGDIVDAHTWRIPKDARACIRETGRGRSG